MVFSAKNEGDEVESVFGPNGQFDLNFIRVNAQERYYSKLAGVTELSRNVKSSERNSSEYSKRKQRRSELLISLHREPSIRT
mgnify:CR=1 FL=1